MKVSVVIPCYNAEKTIETCLRSIFESDFPRKEYEVIVFDNNSSDLSRSIVSNFKEVKLVKENRQGRSFARNKGLDLSLGEYVAFVDADVYLQNNWIMKWSFTWKILVQQVGNHK